MPKVMEDRIFAQIFENDIPAPLSAEDEIKRRYSKRNVIEAPPPARLGSIHDGLDMGTGRRAHNAPKADK